MPNTTKFIGIQNIDLNNNSDEEDINPSQVIVNSSQGTLSSSKYLVVELLKICNETINMVNQSKGDKKILTNAIQKFHNITQYAENISLISHLKILLATNEFNIIEQVTTHPILVPIINYLALKIGNIPLYIDWNITVIKYKIFLIKTKYTFQINWFYTQTNPYIEGK